MELIEYLEDKERYLIQKIKDWPSGCAVERSAQARLYEIKEMKAMAVKNNWRTIRKAQGRKVPNWGKIIEWGFFIAIGATIALGIMWRF